MLGAVDDRDRCTPVALAANQPVTHPVGYLGVATTFLLEPGHDLLTSILAAHTIKCTRINEHAFAMIALVGVWIIVGPLNDGDDGQLVFLGKGGIALIMSRDSHHCTSAIATKDIIGHPDGYSLARRWIYGITSSKDSCLVLRVISALNLRFFDCLGNIGQDCLLGITTREMLRERMFGRQHQEGRTKERIRARRKDGDIGGVTLCSCHGLIKGEADLCSLAAANPVGLSLLDLIWPVERGDVG